MKITFHGVRGSSPSASRVSHRYGGNTSSVTLEVPGQAPLLLDLGTGLAGFGRQVPPRERFTGTALVTHLHFDHVLGLPFFEPSNRPGARLEIYGPPQATGGLAEAFAELMAEGEAMPIDALVAALAASPPPDAPLVVTPEREISVEA